MSGRHFLGLDASTVHTLHFQHTQRALRDVMKHQAIGSITGKAGLGKTFSVETFSPARSRYVLAEVLKVELAARDRLVVVDEAQNLNRPCFEFLRSLHDQPKSRFGLVFVGGDGARHVLAKEPMLSSRIYRPVKFEPLTTPVLYEAVRAFHPALSTLKEDQIRYIDDTAGHGKFRLWASFTHTAVELMAELGQDQIDDRIIRNTFGLMSGEFADV